MAKGIMTVTHFRNKKHVLIENLSPEFAASIGEVDTAFTAIVWGASGNGKSNFTMQLVSELARHGEVLYVSLEEGFSASMKRTVDRQLADSKAHNIRLADHGLTFENALEYLKKQRSPRFVIIDSIQYWGIDYCQYKQLKALFPRKSFVFISHAKGNMPDGKTADKVRYDAGIKIRVEGFIAFVTSRYGGNKNYLIWEEGAKKYWGKKFKTHLK